MTKRRETRQRRQVLDAVTARCDHPTADEIYMDLRKADSRISRGTVYRNLNILADEGKLLRVMLPGADRFEARLDIHYHLVCTGCKSICDLPLDYDNALDEQAAEISGYCIGRHRACFEGLCPDCQKAGAQTK
jgi:Fur family ferric uptake transcriptional regulator